jgi:hypothetical protein
VLSWIDRGGEVVWDPSPSLIAQLVEAGQPFWLDIENPIDEVIDQLAARLGLHPLAIEDSKQFGQYTKLQVYGNGVMLVGFGLDEQLREPVEVHCYCTTGFLITLRRAPSPALDALRHARSVPPQFGSDPIRALQAAGFLVVLGATRAYRPPNSGRHCHGQRPDAAPGRWMGRSAALPQGIRPVSFTGAICPAPHEAEVVVSKGVPT